ncbi:M61 family metallopeptidase [Novosphingobium sp.]|uniref:M61 family metallopeptidase n=1 Tax=Novosphingobium sp. TaxID=1874826 RepID=UPI003B519AAF
MIKPTHLLCSAALYASALLSSAAQAQVQPATNSFPAAVPITINVPDARDVAYPGVIALDVDATDLETGATRVTEKIPVEPGTKQLALLLPEWIPGNHSAAGKPAELVGVHFIADGKELTWHRDPVDVYAYMVDLPAGAREVTAHMIHTPALKGEPGDRVTITREIVNLEWDQFTLYPAGHYVRQIRIKPTVTFPAGFTAYTALDGHETGGGNKNTWDVTDYETLVDSPIFAGKYARRFEIGNKVWLDTVADKPEDLVIAPEHLETYRNLVKEADTLFGARHYDHYDFLLAFSDRMSGVGLEHHRSNESEYLPKAWTDWAASDWDRNVVPHEYTHSWDGKYRRPARLWTPDYRQPMIDDLLWVYEGQTQFWGLVLAARSGVQTKETILGELAAYAGTFGITAGREWRPVVDTTTDPIFAARRPKPFATMSRNEDYYTEGALVWLEADQIIRAGTAGARGLDDFAKAFYGMRNGDWGVLPYTRADVVATMNQVYPYDWDTFFRTRIETPGQPVPVGGIERGGYHLVWKDKPNPYDAGRATEAKMLSLAYSLGMVLDSDGKVMSTIWGSAAFKAGVVPSSQVVAVNGDAYSADTIKAAITAAKGTDKPISLLIKRDSHFETVSITWRDGLRYPWLERSGGIKGPGGLDLLLDPHRAQSSATKPATAKH